MWPGSQGEWTGMCMCEQWWLHCTSQWGRETTLSEYVYCVAITFKMTQQVEQQSCIKVCIKLEHSSAETIWMNQKAVAMRHWWLAPSSQQCTLSGITSCAEFFGETSHHPGDSALLQLRFGALQLLAFPKTKITFEKWFYRQENAMGYLVEIERTVWGPKRPTLNGTELSLSYVKCFLYLVSSSINVSIFFDIFIDYAITVVPFPPLHSTPSCPPAPFHIPPL